MGLSKEDKAAIQRYVGIKGASRWNLDSSTGNSVSAGPDFVAAAGGVGTLTFSQKGKGSISVFYGSLGVSGGVGPPVNVSVSHSENLTKGRLYLLNGFTGEDLEPMDFEGICLVVELAASSGQPALIKEWGNGGQGTAMLIGMSGWKGLASEAAKFSSWLGRHGGPGIPVNIDNYLQGDAKALLVMAGTETSGGGISLTGSLGKLSLIRSMEPHPPIPPPPKPVPVPFPCPGLPCNFILTEEKTVKRVTIHADFLFDFDKDFIRRDAEAALREVSKIIAAKPGCRVGIVGHTDSIGDLGYNMGLSLRRAMSVQKWFLSFPPLKTALKPYLVFVAGQGPLQPVERNVKPNGKDNPDGRQKNRRVEITISPL
jgi:outer membrane protein OmpA-like peptidoglycan-associated protein